MKLLPSLSPAAFGALACLANLASVSAAPGEVGTVVPVPWAPVQINGCMNGASTPTAAYRAYAIPGDPFRLVVPDPNPIGEPLIYADYAGFKLARQDLVTLTGIDTPANLRPVDVFISACTWTGAYQSSFTGTSGVYGYGCGPTTGYMALFSVDHAKPILAFTPENACRVEAQLLGMHEYTHLLFITRCADSPIYEDVCKACSFYVSGYWISPGNVPAYFYALTDPADEKLNHPQAGQWIYELGKRHGASWPQLRQAFMALAAKYDVGGGEVPVSGAETLNRISENQVRWILNAILVNDTKSAFLAVGVPEANLPTRSLYFPFVVTGGVFRSSFRFPAPAGTRGNLEGLLYFYDADGQPQPVTMTASLVGSTTKFSPYTGPIQAVVTSAVGACQQQAAPAAGQLAVGWARFDSLAPIAAEADLRRDVQPALAAQVRLSEPGVAAATSFSLAASTTRQTVAIINPGTAPIKVAVYATLGRKPGKTPVQTITIERGHQYVATVAELVHAQEYKGTVRLQSSDPFAAMIFRAILQKPVGAPSAPLKLAPAGK